MYPAIEPRRLTGDESLIAPNGEKVGSLIDFWRWAYSDLVSNAERGILAEYIVSCALGINQTVRSPWNKYDLLTQDNVSIEVKTSGYLQAWEQKTCRKLCLAFAQHTDGTVARMNMPQSKNDRRMYMSSVYITTRSRRLLTR